jgi:hypothetical protein
MQTSRLITITAALFALAVPAASARPAFDPAAAQAAKPTASTPASIAAHREQMSAQQDRASHSRTEATSLEDRTAADGPSPILFVLVGLTVPLGIALAHFVAKPALAHRRRRSPAGVA